MLSHHGSKVLKQPKEIAFIPWGKMSFMSK